MGRFETFGDEAGGGASLDGLIAAAAIVTLLIGIYRGLRGIKDDAGAPGLIVWFLCLASQVLGVWLISSGERWLAMGIMVLGVVLCGVLIGRGATPPFRPPG